MSHYILTTFIEFIIILFIDDKSNFYPIFFYFVWIWTRKFENNFFLPKRKNPKTNKIISYQVNFFFSWLNANRKFQTLNMNVEFFPLFFSFSSHLFILQKPTRKLICVHSLMHAFHFFFFLSRYSISFFSTLFIMYLYCFGMLFNFMRKKGSLLTSFLFIRFSSFLSPSLLCCSNVVFLCNCTFDIHSFIHSAFFPIPLFDSIFIIDASTLMISASISATHSLTRFDDDEKANILKYVANSVLM